MGEDRLSEASSAAQTNGTGAKAHPWGYARAPMVLGPFAETKEPVLSKVEGTPSCGGETPHEKGKDTGFPIKNVGNDS